MSIRTQAMIDAVINLLAEALRRSDPNLAGVVEFAIEDLKELKREDMKREN
jgi:hypothetical protein